LARVPGAMWCWSMVFCWPIFHESSGSAGLSAAGGAFSLRIGTRRRKRAGAWARQTRRPGLGWSADEEVPANKGLWRLFIGSRIFIRRTWIQAAAEQG